MKETRIPGVSPVIASALLVSITLLAGAMLWSYAYYLASNTVKSVADASRGSADLIVSGLEIVYANTSSDQGQLLVLVLNSGSKDLRLLRIEIYSNGSQKIQSLGGEILPPGGVRLLRIGLEEVRGWSVAVYVFASPRPSGAEGEEVYAFAEVRRGS